MVEETAGPLCAAVIEQCADAIIFADREGRITLWNAAAARMFGFSVEEALGQSLDIVIPEYLRARHWAGYRDAIESGKTKHSGRPMLTKGLHRSGATLYAEVSFAVVSDPAAGSLGSVAIARQPREQPVPGQSGKPP
jgi:PAS domain S-box-containing protein